MLGHWTTHYVYGLFTKCPESYRSLFPAMVAHDWKSCHTLWQRLNKGPVVPRYQSWPCRRRCFARLLTVYRWRFLFYWCCFQAHSKGVEVDCYQGFVGTIKCYIVDLWLSEMACASWLISILFKCFVLWYVQFSVCLITFKVQMKSHLVILFL